MNAKLNNDQAAQSKIQATEMKNKVCERCNKKDELKMTK